MPGRRRRRPALLAAVLSVAAALAVPAAARAATAEVLRIDFDQISGPDGTPVEEIRVTGTAVVTADIASRHGGQVLAATARPGRGRAVSLPTFDPTVNGPRAVVRVQNDTSKDKLSPGVQDFTFGADFVLDAESSQPGSSDDGDNLVQRGLYDDPYQYKLQIDNRRPSCRLKGTIDGDPAVLEVASKVSVDATHWYGVDCVRTGTKLEVVVKQFHDDGSTTTTTRSASSAKPIKIRMASSSVPFSVGGKLGADGAVLTDTDQFNGTIDNVFMQVG